MCVSGCKLHLVLCAVVQSSCHNCQMYEVVPPQFAMCPLNCNSWSYNFSQPGLCHTLLWVDRLPLSSLIPRQPDPFPGPDVIRGNQTWL